MNTQCQNGNKPKTLAASRMASERQYKTTPPAVYMGMSMVQKDGTNGRQVNVSLRVPRIPPHRPQFPSHTHASSDRLTKSSGACTTVGNPVFHQNLRCQLRSAHCTRDNPAGLPMRSWYALKSDGTPSDTPGIRTVPRCNWHTSSAAHLMGGYAPTLVGVRILMGGHGKGGGRPRPWG